MASANTGGNVVTIPYVRYSQFYDNCMMETFDLYARRFRTMHIVLSTLSILLLSITSILNGIDLANDDDDDDDSASDWIDLATVITGGIALFLRGAETQLGLLEAEQQCIVARADVEHYLISRQPMPDYVEQRILAANTLCFRFPRRCAQTNDAGNTA